MNKKAKVYKKDGLWHFTCSCGDAAGRRFGYFKMQDAFKAAVRAVTTFHKEN